MIIVDKEKKFAVVIWSFFTLICFLCFEFYYDNAVLIATGNLILSGHLYDLYECVEEMIGPSGIYPILYPLIYAIWNFPLKLLTGKVFVDCQAIPIGVLLWNKALVFICYIACGYLLKQIIMRVKQSCADNIYKVWFIMPLAFFSAIIMGMYDIGYVLLMLLALNYYFKDWEGEKYNRILFVLFFGLSICLKTLPIFYFIPLIVIREKRIWALIKDLLFFIIPYVFCCVPFLHSDAFIRNCLMLSERNSGMLLVTTVGDINVLIVSFLVLCFFCFFFIDNKDYVENSIFVGNIVSAILFGFSRFHPQWIIIAVPFMVLGLVNVKKEQLYKYILVLSLATIGFYIIFSILNEDGHIGNLLEDGILGTKIGTAHLFDEASAVSLNDFYKVDDLRIAYSIFAASLWGFAILVNPKMKNKVCKNENVVIDSSNTGGLLVVIFILTMLVYVFPVYIRYLGLLPKYILETPMEYSPDNTSALDISRGNEVTTAFKCETRIRLDKIEFLSFTWDNEYGDSLMHVRVLDNSGDEMAEISYPLSNIRDHTVTSLRWNDVHLDPGSYFIVFDTNEIQNSFAIAAIKNQEASEIYYSGEKIMDTDIQMKITGTEEK